MEMGESIIVLDSFFVYLTQKSHLGEEKFNWWLPPSLSIGHVYGAYLNYLFIWENSPHYGQYNPEGDGSGL